MWDLICPGEDGIREEMYKVPKRLVSDYQKVAEWLVNWFKLNYPLYFRDQVLDIKVQSCDALLEDLDFGDCECLIRYTMSELPDYIRSYIIATTLDDQIEEGYPDFSDEAKLCKIEAAAEHVASKLRRRGCFPNFTINEMIIFSRFYPHGQDGDSV